MSNSPGMEPDLNGISYTATYFISLKLLNGLEGLTEQDKEHFKAMYESVKVRPGLINRRPGDRVRQSHDDITQLSCAAFFVMPYIATDIYNYGVEHFWVYNNTDDWSPMTIFKTWHFKLPGVVQTVKMCAKIPWTAWDRLYFAWDIFTTTFRKADDASGRIRDWSKIKVYESSPMHKCKIVDMAIALWKIDIAKKYAPDMMGGVFHVYFDRAKLEEETDFVHPFAVHWDGSI